MAIADSSKRSTLRLDGPPFIRVLFCGEDFHQGYLNSVRILKAHANVEVIRCPRSEVDSLIGSADILVPLGAMLDRERLLKATKCQRIVQFGVGLEKVDVSAATSLDIHVSNMPSGATGNALSCAELAIYLMLAALRRGHDIEAAFQNGKIGFPTGQTLWGKTCLVLGFGNIAAELVPSPWSDSEAERLVDLKGSWDDRFAFASQADLVALACTQCQATMGLINAHFLAACKPGVTIVNVARGGLLDYEAVKQGLVDGRIGALGLDVQWEEPFNPDDFISRHPRVYMTPHIAGVTDLAFSNMAVMMKGEVEQMLAGLPPLMPVNTVHARRFAQQDIANRVRDLSSDSEWTYKAAPGQDDFGWTPVTPSQSQ